MKRESASPLRHVKEELASPQHNCDVQIERRVKEELASPPHHRSVQIGRRVKEELASPPRNWYDRMDVPSSTPHRHRLGAKEEFPSAIKRAWVRLLYYLEGGGYGSASGSRAVSSEAEAR